MRKSSLTEILKTKIVRYSWNYSETESLLNIIYIDFVSKERSSNEAIKLKITSRQAKISTHRGVKKKKKFLSRDTSLKKSDDKELKKIPHLKYKTSKIIAIINIIGIRIYHIKI